MIKKNADGKQKSTKIEVVKSYSKIRDFVDTMKKRGRKFTYERRGKIHVYSTNNTERTFYVKSERYGGLHLISLVKKQIYSNLDNQNIKIPCIEETDDLRTVFYSKKNIHNKQNKQQKIVAIDFNRCYWYTAYRLKYIDEILFKKGLSKPEYKDGCNVAIGTLGAKKWVQNYDKGILQGETRIVQPYTYPLRLAILREVNNISKEIINHNSNTKNGFLFFLTDCFFVVESVKDIYIELLKGYGYDCKCTEYDKYDIETKVSRSGRYRNTVKWDYFDDESKKNQSAFIFTKKLEL